MAALQVVRLRVEEVLHSAYAWRKPVRMYAVTGSVNNRREVVARIRSRKRANEFIEKVVAGELIAERVSRTPRRYAIIRDNAKMPKVAWSGANASLRISLIVDEAL